MPLVLASAVYVSGLTHSYLCACTNPNWKVLVKNGSLGHHLDALLQISPEKVEYWGRLNLIATVALSALASTLPKTVILAVYLRVFVKKWSRIMCYIIGAILIVACIINMAMAIWRCSPLDYIWNKSIKNGYCRVDLQTHIRWGLFPNVITDVAMLILPLVCIDRTNSFILYTL